MTSKSADPWRGGSHVVFRLHAHVVLVTKYRRKVISERVAEELGAAFAEVCERSGVVIEAFETEGDHAHLLISYPPKIALSQIVMLLKANGARRVRAHGWPEVRQLLRGSHFWSPSYAVVSCGGAPLEIVKRYVEQQRRPGRKQAR